MLSDPRQYGAREKLCPYWKYYFTLHCFTLFVLHSTLRVTSTCRSPGYRTIEETGPVNSLHSEKKITSKLSKRNPG